MMSSHIDCSVLFLQFLHQHTKTLPLTHIHIHKTTHLHPNAHRIPCNGLFAAIRRDITHRCLLPRFMVIAFLLLSPGASGSSILLPSVFLYFPLSSLLLPLAGCFPTNSGLVKENDKLTNRSKTFGRLSRIPISPTPWQSCATPYCLWEQNCVHVCVCNS